MYAEIHITTVLISFFAISHTSSSRYEPLEKYRDHASSNELSDVQLLDIQERQQPKHIKRLDKVIQSIIPLLSRVKETPVEKSLDEEVVKKPRAMNVIKKQRRPKKTKPKFKFVKLSLKTDGSKEAADTVFNGDDKKLKSLSYMLDKLIKPKEGQEKRYFSQSLANSYSKSSADEENREATLLGDETKYQDPLAIFVNKIMQKKKNENRHRNEEILSNNALIGEEDLMEEGVSLPLKLTFNFNELVE